MEIELRCLEMPFGLEEQVVECEEKLKVEGYVNASNLFRSYRSTLVDLKIYNLGAGAFLGVFNAFKQGRCVDNEKMREIYQGFACLHEKLIDHREEVAKKLCFFSELASFAGRDLEGLSFETEIKLNMLSGKCEQFNNYLMQEAGFQEMPMEKGK